MVKALTNKQREAAIQRPCHQLMTQHAPKGCIYHSIPNEGKRSKVMGAQLKLMGLRPGAADYLILWNGNAIYIEFKCDADLYGDKTYQSKDQKAFEVWVNAGAKSYYFVVRSTAEFLGTLKPFGLLTNVRFG